MIWQNPEIGLNLAQNPMITRALSAILQQHKKATIRKMKKIIMWTFILGLFGCNNSKSQSNKIQLEKIEEMFSNLKSNGVNTDTTMLWGYFFTSNKKRQIRASF